MVVVITLKTILDDKNRQSFLPDNSSAARMRPKRPWPSLCLKQTCSDFCWCCVSITAGLENRRM